MKMKFFFRKLCTSSWQQAKNNSINGQVKVMSKLFGKRNTGSKKRWYPVDNAYGAANTNINFAINAKKHSSHDGKNNTRRMQVLNKLFMEHISSLLATGEASEKILGRGLQVTRVKISMDYALINVYWMASGLAQADAELEQELHRCSGILRHELSQLELMGHVPRIKFVRDRSDINLMQVDAILKTLDLSTEEDSEENVPHNLKQEFFGSAVQNSNKNIDLLEMRHDVFGLDHKEMMSRILSKMRKSKQAWDQHNQQNTVIIEEIPEPKKLEEQTKDFKDFLAKRRTRKNVPERKKFSREELWLQSDYENEPDYTVLSHQQKRLYEEEDYLNEDETERTKYNK